MGRSARRSRWVSAVRPLAIVACAAVTLTGCATSAVGGQGTFVAPAKAANVPASQLPIQGDGGTAFDMLTRNALADVEQFWKQAYPTVSGGAALIPLRGGVWSVTTGKPNSGEKCMQEVPKAADNNAFYCSLDDAFAYDRTGLVKTVTDKVGTNFAPLVFAHEFGHLIQNRLKIQRKSILLESQADCASGAFMAAEAGVGTVKLTNRHFIIDPKSLDEVAIGMILLRDYSPHSAEDRGSHGNGFDRLSAFSDGFDKGPKFCYSADWVNRKFTERTYSSEQDAATEGNETFDMVINAGPSAQGGGGLQPDLNRYWTSAFKRINKAFKAVLIKQATSPPCATDKRVRFGYCANDNTVYFDNTTAAQIYNGMPAIVRDPSTRLATVKAGAPADFLLGAMFGYGWGVAVRSQLGLSIDGTPALLGASCYLGAYAQDVNNPTKSGFALSPQDMDEASVAVMQEADQPEAFGQRNTTAFERIGSFKKGYFGTLTACT